MREECDLVIAGGGPAGLMAGLLFARAGVRTTVLEKHADFLRDFRGDTIHPSTLRIFAELGLIDGLLRRPHDKVRRLGAYISGRRYEIADFSKFDPCWNFIAMMPQWEFLDFVADAARDYPNFRLVMEAEAHSLITDAGRVSGLRYRKSGADIEISSRLVIAADGRQSVLRAQSGLPLKVIGAPIDVFWFRLPKKAAPDNESAGIFAAGRIMVLIDRHDYWQCAYVFPKGQAQLKREAGFIAFRADVARTAPMLADKIGAISSWDDVKLLTVGLDRLEQWHVPGLLVIGDAAHTMSPVGGIGINVAVQDAIAAANILAGPMAEGADIDSLLSQVQARRMPAVKLIQSFQRAVQDRIISPLLASRDGEAQPPLAVKLLNHFPLLRRIPAAFIGFGIRSEHVRSPAA